MSDAETPTLLLKRIADGDRSAADELLPLVYDELKRLARSYMRAERSDHTLQPTAVVHEAYLHLIRRDGEWEGRRHFLAVAALAMKTLLVDHAKGRARAKRGGDRQRVSLHDAAMRGESGVDVNLLDLHDALAKLASLDERQARIAELRYFGGMTTTETAAELGVGTATVERDWKVARAWLRVQLSATPRVEGHR